MESTSMQERAKRQRGFAAMSPERQKEIARKGGQAAHAKGTAHEFTHDEAREAGRKGGEAVSRRRDHMVEIGRRGGAAVSANRDHMARIGREGGSRARLRRAHEKPGSVPPNEPPRVEGAPPIHVEGVTHIEDA